jgi:Flp pilus assembly protein TadD
MYSKGVKCSDCHEPHSLKLRAAANAVCAQCHLQQKYQTSAHHFHAPESSGAQCVACHMPARTYMVVDPRRDHSFRIPRPDLSVKLGTPNACTGCHREKSVTWATQTIERWYGAERKGFQNFAVALQAGRAGTVDAPRLLARLARDDAAPAIARATALAALNRYPSEAALDAARQGLLDADPLVRMAALGVLENLEPAARSQLAAPLLNDAVRAVRMQAAQILAPLSPQGLSPQQRVAFERALAEYIDAQHLNADRPEAHLNLGLLYAQRAEFRAAEQEYRTAMRIAPSFIQAYVNLADLYRAEGRDAEGERLLREAGAIEPENADIYHALGLLLVRQKRMPQALEALARAAMLAPEHARYGYVYGVALHSLGQKDRAIAVLEQTHTRQPADRDVLLALITFNRDAGLFDAALKHARELVQIAPADPQAAQLLRQLQAQRP